MIIRVNTVGGSLNHRPAAREAGPRGDRPSQGDQQGSEGSAAQGSVARGPVVRNLLSASFPRIEDGLGRGQRCFFGFHSM